jgi:two-component system nitrate/nitrite response regulator NarL
MKSLPRSAFDAMSKMNGSMNGSMNPDVLSVREREVMLLAAKGLPNKVIARELNVAEGTVKLHLHRVYQKLGINGRFALAAQVGNLLSTSMSKRSAPIPPLVK